MRCLSDVELQAVADDEGAESLAAHVAGCARCRARLDDRRRELRDIKGAVNTAGDLPPRLAARVREAIAAHEPVRGATTLRTPAAAPIWRRPGVVLPLATAAVIAVVVFGILPRFGSPTTLSAAQVLGRSLETLTTQKGIEIANYDLSVSGIHEGAYRLELAIDHGQPARFRARTFTPDGVLVAAISQDPGTQRRSQLVRVDGRNYIVTVGSLPSPIVSAPQMAQALVETAITMMQATSDQKLTVVEGASGRRYVVEIPPVTPTTTATTLDLHRARVVVDAADYRILEFQAAGALLRQPFDVSFTLTSRVTSAAVTPYPFELEPGPGDVVLHGIAADHPIDELLFTVVRELAAARNF